MQQIITMKIHLKFDHSKDNLLEAIDCVYTKREVDAMLVDLTMKCLFDDKSERISEVCEMVHDTLDYEIILYLATHQILSNTKRITDLLDESI